MRNELNLEPLYLNPKYDEAKWRKKFSKKLDKMMRANKVSNNELAYAIGLSGSVVSCYRRGATSPNIYTVVLICKALGCTMSALIDD